MLAWPDSDWLLSLVVSVKLHFLKDEHGDLFCFLFYFCGLYWQFANSWFSPKYDAFEQTQMQLRLRGFFLFQDQNLPKKRIQTEQG